MNSYLQLIYLLACLCFASCLESKNLNANNANNANNAQDTLELTFPTKELDKIECIKDRFLPPLDFTRKALDNNSFGSFLRHLKLKPIETNVLYFDGRIKSNPVYAAVVDLPIGNKDLHQCADAIIRLRADYLRSIDKQELISFKFTNGMNVPYKKWMNGYRIKINGKSTSWEKSKSPSDTNSNYWSYLETIFMYAGTLSLSKELSHKSIQQMSIGDVFIQGGSPGHAVIVVDMVEDNSGNKLFMIAQSYMPAQEIHILNNQNDPTISPWYKLDALKEEMSTPEWDFKTNDLKEF